MKRLAVVILLLTATFSASGDIRGAWTADASEKESGKVYFQFNRKHNNNGRTMPLASFTGLSAAQVHSASQVPVAFSLRGEPGTISFEGTFRDSFGAGQFSFAPNPAFLDSVRSMGIRIEPEKLRSGHERSQDEALLQYTISDLSTAFIRSMQAEGYNVSLHEYLSFRIFNVTPDLVRELRALGFDKVSADDLVATRIHKVTPAYIREMRAAGFGELSLDGLVATRIHKVTPEFIRELRELGYDKVPASKLVSMRIHRVTPEFIRELKAAGYSGIPVDKLISMRIHGVDAEFAKKMNGM